MAFDKPDYYESNRRKRTQREAHRHVPAKVEGNKVICACGKMCGFLRDPKKAAGS